MNHEPLDRLHLQQIAAAYAAGYRMARAELADDTKYYTLTQCYRKFGRGTVDRWAAEGLIEIIKDGTRNSKCRVLAERIESWSPRKATAPAGSTITNNPQRWERMYKRWDKFEVQDVIARYLSGEDVQAIAEEYGRSVRSIEMMIYRQGLHRRVKSPVNDRAKLDCMPDPFEWMGGKDHL